jgi:hypothetical protein
MLMVRATCLLSSLCSCVLRKSQSREAWCQSYWMSCLSLPVAYCEPFVQNCACRCLFGALVCCSWELVMVAARIRRSSWPCRISVYSGKTNQFSVFAVEMYWLVWTCTSWHHSRIVMSPQPQTDCTNLELYGHTTHVVACAVIVRWSPFGHACFQIPDRILTKSAITRSCLCLAFVHEKL